MTHRVFANRFLPLPIQACVHFIKAGLDARRDDEQVGIEWGELDPRANSAPKMRIKTALRQFAPKKLRLNREAKSLMLLSG